jgi:hypothetical protein
MSLHSINTQTPARRIRDILQALHVVGPTRLTATARTALIVEARGLCRAHPHLETVCVQSLGEEWVVPSAERRAA